MGVGPSLGKVMRSMEDEELIEMIQEAYRSDPTRIDKLLVTAKQRYLASLASPPSSMASTCTPSAHTMVATASPHLMASSNSCSSSMASVTATSASPAFHELQNVKCLANPLRDAAAGHSSGAPTTTASRATASIDSTPLGSSSTNAIKSQTDALWRFEGHTLRELQPACKQPKTGSSVSSQGNVDEEGHLILFGNGGRDKRYARCSVCYFRGLRCNTAHYCASCQRAVCIRPRVYPNEEQPKICWNVLHMDKDMICRVQKKKKRRVHGSHSSSDNTSTSGSASTPVHATTSATGSSGTPAVPSSVSTSPASESTALRLHPRLSSSLTSNAVVAAAEAIAAGSYTTATTSATTTSCAPHLRDA